MIWEICFLDLECWFLFNYSDSDSDLQWDLRMINEKWFELMIRFIAKWQFMYRRILHTAHTLQTHAANDVTWITCQTGEVKTLETNLGGGLRWSVIDISETGGDTRPNLTWRSIFRCFSFISRFRWFLFFWGFDLQSTLNWIPIQSLNDPRSNDYCYWALLSGATWLVYESMRYDMIW